MCDTAIVSRNERNTSMKLFKAWGPECARIYLFTFMSVLLLSGCSSVGPGESNTGSQETETTNSATTEEVDEPAENETEPATEEETEAEDDCGECADNQVCVDGECVCEPGYVDCDGDEANGCEQAGMCPCEIGTERPCYFGPAATEGVGICSAGVEVCQPAGTWGYCEGQVLPGVESCTADGIDQDCDGEFDEIDDLDGDGWTICDGDCCDDPNENCGENPALINPGAYDAPGNEIDDDCDGVVDLEPRNNCSDEMIITELTGADIMMGMDLCQFTGDDPDRWGIIESTLSNIAGDGMPFDFQASVLPGFSQGTIPPMSNETVSVLSSGDARGVGDPGYTLENSDGYPMYEEGPLEYLEAHQNTLATSESCPVPEPSFHDTLRVSTKIRVPTNAMGIKFQFRFFTHEFPAWVCTEWNDVFLALLTSEHEDIPLDKNISFDQAGNPISVNSAFFTACEPRVCGVTPDDVYVDIPDVDNDGCPDSLSCNTETNLCENDLGACPDGAEALLAFSGDTSQGGATGWLSTTAPVVPGEEITLEFMIWDTGDASFDSLIILDGFEWLLEPTQLITKN
jgi:hypothetical protein